jgi:hypothetical protein
MEYGIIKSLCNRSKHFSASKYDFKKNIHPGFDFDNIDFDDMNFGGKLFFVECKGQDINVYDVCMSNFNQWRSFFENYREFFISIGYA